jgi:hypothetical protein
MAAVIGGLFAFSMSLIIPLPDDENADRTKP